jgi:tetratricopeptide (TPR) repeat protein
MPNQDSTRWWVLAEAALAAAIVLLPVALGGAPDWSFWLLLATSMAACVSWCVGAWRHRRRLTLHPLLLVPLGLLVVALGSLIPLPPSLLEVLSPMQFELRTFALVPLGLDGWRPLTVDPASTWRAVGRLVALEALAVTALQLGRLEASRRRVLALIAATGALIAVVGFGHLLAGATSLFGVYQFYGSPPLLTFFGNTNHLAAALAFAAIVSIACVFEAPSRDAAVGWTACALMNGVGVFLSFSRGGIGTFIFTAVAVGGLLLVRRQGGLRSMAPWLIIGATSVFAISLAADQLATRLDSVSSFEGLRSTKLDLWPMFMRAALAFGRAGMGLGSFELAFSPLQSTQFGVTFTYPENVVLQWLCELGLPLASLLMLVSGWIAVLLWRQARGALADQILLFAIGGLLLHDVFDFALELNALPVWATVVLGLVAAKEPRGAPEPRRLMVRRGAVMAVVLFGLGGSVALSRGLPTHLVAEQQLASRLAANQPLPEILDAATRAVDRHPADAVLYAQMAQHLSQVGSAREALAWVNRALQLRPGDAIAHVSAAEALLRLQNPTQALLEYKAAWQLGDSSSLDRGLLLASRLHAWDRLVVEAPGLLTTAWERYRALDRLPDAEALINAALTLPPSRAIELEARVLAVKQAQALHRDDEVLTQLELLPAELQTRSDLVVLQAEALARTSRPTEGIARLEALARRQPQDLAVALTLTTLLAQEGRTAEALETLTRVRPFAVGPMARSALFQREAELWVHDERWGRALDALQAASRIESARPDLRYRLAQVYERMGSLHSALDELRKGRLLDTPAGAKAQDAWVDRLEAATASSPGVALESDVPPK